MKGLHESWNKKVRISAKDIAERVFCRKGTERGTTVCKCELILPKDYSKPLAFFCRGRKYRRFQMLGYLAFVLVTYDGYDLDWLFESVRTGLQPMLEKPERYRPNIQELSNRRYRLLKWRNK